MWILVKYQQVMKKGKLPIRPFLKENIPLGNMPFRYMKKLCIVLYDELKLLDLEHGH